jgi:hypothetical protein
MSDLRVLFSHYNNTAASDARHQERNCPGNPCTASAVLNKWPPVRQSNSHECCTQTTHRALFLQLLLSIRGTATVNAELYTQCTTCQCRILSGCALPPTVLLQHCGDDEAVHGSSVCTSCLSSQTQAKPCTSQHSVLRVVAHQPMILSACTWPLMPCDRGPISRPNTHNTLTDHPARKCTCICSSLLPCCTVYTARTSVEILIT